MATLRQKKGLYLILKKGRRENMRVDISLHQ